MKHYFAYAAIAAVLAGPVLAAEPLNGTQFENYVTGKTLYFGQNGQAYGVEEYLDDRRVRWSSWTENARTGCGTRIRG